MNSIRFILLYPLFTVLSLATNELLPNVVIVPVPGAQCLTLHPSKPVLYVGLPTGGEHGFAALSLDEKGVPIAGSRKDFADELVDETPVLKGSEYCVGDIAVNPVLPEIYLSAWAKKFNTFRADGDAADVVAIALDEAGFPREKIRSLRSDWRLSPVAHLTCDPLGRYVYLGETRSGIGIWPVGEEQRDPAIQMRTLGTRKRPPVRRQKEAGRFPVLAPDWVYVPAWKRCYGYGSPGQKVVFSFGEDGVSCTFAQQVTTPGPYEFTPLISVKHQRMYVPYALGTKLGIYLLTHEGHLTSLPHFMDIDAPKVLCLDDQRDRLYIVTAQNALTVYSLNADGDPAEPQRYTLNLGAVNAAVLSPTTGLLYLTCAAPGKGKP